jgi:hypothetical protein
LGEDPGPGVVRRVRALGDHLQAEAVARAAAVTEPARSWRTGRARLADVGPLAELLFVDPLLMVALVGRGI